MPYESLETRREGRIEYLTLNRPEVRNAFNEQVIRELTEWADRTRSAALRHDLRVVVLAGAGASFCAGADVAWMAKTVTYTDAENIRDASAMSSMFAAIDQLPLPLVGRVHGAALGGGAGLVAVCDIAIAADDALFGFTEVKLGILPAVISPFVLAKIGRSAARELFLTGARFAAARARDIGLVHAVVPASHLDAAVTRYVNELLTAGPDAIAAAKALIPRVSMQPAEAAAYTSHLIAERRVSAEGQEGLKAFLEKRKASWSL